ncbi:hypothetical protein D3C85_749250 [compost metagenome]
MNLLDQGQKIVMDQHQIVFGVIHGVAHLVCGKANVHSVQNRANHRDSKKTLQITMTVPVEQRYGIACLDARCRQGVGQTLYPLIKCPIAVTQFVGIDNLLLWLVPGS